MLEHIVSSLTTMWIIPPLFLFVNVRRLYELKCLVDVMNRLW